MSKGMGRIERDTLSLINENSGKLDALTIAALIYFEDPTDALGQVTRAQLASVRRALASLRRKGQVFRLGRFYPFGHGVTLPQTMYANLDGARAFLDNYRRHFGNKGLVDYPDLLALILPPESPKHRAPDNATGGLGEKTHGKLEH